MGFGKKVLLYIVMLVVVWNLVKHGVFWVYSLPTRMLLLRKRRALRRERKEVEELRKKRV